MDGDYTAIGLKLAFRPTRKLARIDDRKRVNIRNMDPFTIVDSSGFGAVEIRSFRPMAVYILFFFDKIPFKFP